MSFFSHTPSTAYKPQIRQEGFSPIPVSATASTPGPTDAAEDREGGAGRDSARSGSDSDKNFNELFSMPAHTFINDRCVSRLICARTAPFVLRSALRHIFFVLGRYFSSSYVRLFLHRYFHMWDARAARRLTVLHGPFCAGFAIECAVLPRQLRLCPRIPDGFHSSDMIRLYEYSGNGCRLAVVLVG